MKYNRRQFLILSGGTVLVAATPSAQGCSGGYSEPFPAALLGEGEIGPFEKYMAEKYKISQWRNSEVYPNPEISIKTPRIAENSGTVSLGIEVHFDKWIERWKNIIEKEEKEFGSIEKRTLKPLFLSTPINRTIVEIGPDNLFVNQIHILSGHVTVKYESIYIQDVGSAISNVSYSYDYVHPVAKFRLSEQSLPKTKFRYRRISRNSRIAVVAGIAKKGSGHLAFWVLSGPTMILKSGECRGYDLEF